jgi:hypothetical protein
MMIGKVRKTGKVATTGKVRNLKLVRSNAPKQSNRRKLLVNEDGSLVADFDSSFVTLHNNADSIMLSWPEAVELALAIAVHARLPI